MSCQHAEMLLTIEQLDETVSSGGSSCVFLQRRHGASRRNECSLHSTTKPAFSFSFPAPTRLLAEVKHSHAHPPRRCIIPSVAYQSFPLPLSGLFHRNFNFSGALARQMQFRFLAPPARRKQRLSRLGPKTPASGVSPSVTRSCLLLHGFVRLIIYLPRPAACEPPPPPAIFQPVFRFTLKC